MQATHIVPSGFWKIVADWDSGTDVRVAAFIMPQDALRAAAVSEFRVTVAAVEQRSGLTFFTELPDDERQAIRNRLDTDWLLP